MKFKRGDIITAVKDCPYSVTTNNGTYEVIYVYGDGSFIRVRVVEHIKSSNVGHQFDVEPKYFIYAKDFVHWEGIFNRAYNEKTFDIENGIPVVEGVSKDSPCYKQLCDEYAKYMESMEKEEMQ